jgi:hypothetical protein
MSLKTVFRGVLITIPIVMICWQVYASNFQHLTKWKGGGYGMYTDSHPEHRSIVLETSDTLLTIYPITNEVFDQLSKTDQQHYQSSRKVLKLSAFYPEFYRGDLEASTWFQRYQASINQVRFYESYVDLEKRSIYPNLIYTYE